MASARLTENNARDLKGKNAKPGQETQTTRGLPQPSQGGDKGTQPVTFRHVYKK